jgi:hypothetical protein
MFCHLSDLSKRSVWRFLYELAETLQSYRDRALINGVHGMSQYIPIPGQFHIMYVQRHMGDWYFETAKSWEDLVAAHKKWVFC